MRSDSRPPKSGAACVHAGYSPADAARRARLLDQRHGESSRDRMRRIFRNVPVIYGFSSTAPLGPTAASRLGRYFQSAPAAEVGNGRPSPRLLGQFAAESMIVVSGIDDADPHAVYRREESDTARYSGESNPPDERKLQIGETVMKLADEIGRPASQVALNWLRQRQALIIPIIGARRAAQIQDNLKCLDWQLTGEQIARLDEATKIELGFPHDFLANEFVRQIVFGGTHAAIDNHRG